MLFRTHEGKLVEITKLQFKNDIMYYQKIRALKQAINVTRNSVSK